jgi:hypothetical protein
MIASAIRITFVALSIGTQAGLAVAAGPPKLDIRPSCEAAVRYALTAGRDEKACFDDERTAQDAVTKGWSQYSADDKAQCVGMVNAGGPPSYVELQSCLEMMRDAAAIQNDSQDDPLGNPPTRPATRTSRASPAPMPQQPHPPAQSSPN